MHLLWVVLPTHDLLRRSLVQHGVAPLQIASDLRRAKSLALLNECLVDRRSPCNFAGHWSRLRTNRCSCKRRVAKVNSRVDLRVTLGAKLRLASQARRTSRRVSIHEVARSKKARTSWAQVLIIDCFLRDSTHCLQFQHVVDEL